MKEVDDLIKSISKDDYIGSDGKDAGKIWSSVIILTVFGLIMIYSASGI